MNILSDVTISEIKGGVTAAQGYTASGVACGIKQSGNKDMSLLVSSRPASAAAVFTTNKMAAPPVHLSKEHLADGYAQAVVINSGNANACTGNEGYEDAVAMARSVGTTLAIDPRNVVVSSTGIIGVPLPMSKVIAGIEDAAGKLAADGGSCAAEAIMTTDTFPKEYAVVATIGGADITIGGMAKGSGMIAPNMATMLAVVTTDALVAPDLLKMMLLTAVDKSFNSITVDGDTSTNDMVVILANGESGAEVTPDNAIAFQMALDEVCVELAKLIVKDGEGATKLIEVNVTGAASDADAKKAAMAIANSNLVKTAFFGEDANWGRIVAAVGYSSADVDASKVDVSYGSEMLVEDGRVVEYDQVKVGDIIRARDIKVTVDLKLGPGAARVWTCDFSYDYVKINAEYHT